MLQAVGFALTTICGTYCMVRQHDDDLIKARHDKEKRDKQ